MKELIIFDLDGTLINSIADLGTATNYALRQNGYPEHELSKFNMLVGNGVSKLIEHALPETERTCKNIERIKKDFKTYYNEHNTDLTQPYPGIPELLETLQQKGIKMAVASNKYFEATEVLVKHFFPTINFVAIEGQREGIPVKPDPSIVFSILAQAKERKADSLYVGDSGVDMETARRACIDSVGVTWGFRPEKELVEYHAGHIVSKPAEIEKIVEQYVL